MADRKAELEQKKAKLIALRESKKKREEIKRAVHEEGSTPDLSSSGGYVDLRQTTEDLLKGIGLPPPVETTAVVNNTAIQENVGSDHWSAGSMKKRRNLQVSAITESSVPPPQSIQYCKDTQTIELPNEREVLTFEDNAREDVDAGAALAELRKMPHVGLSTVGPKERRAEGLEDKTPEETKPPPQLSEEQKAEILSSDAFAHFFDRAARVLERAICEPDDDLFFDYSMPEHEKETSDEWVTVSHEFFDDRWSKHRTVTSLEWSPLFPELLLAAYHVNEEATHEPEGVCLIWNMKYPKKTSPEYVFHCQSPLTSATLSKFHPNIVIGGTYSGQIVLWDSRVNKRTPVQRSPLTSWAHTHPVFAVTFVGTQNAHHLISLASDGSLCAWTLEMLAQPREKTKVCDAPAGGLFEVYPTCMSFFANDVNNYAVGAENGNAYCEQRHSSRSSVTEESSKQVAYKGHCAPITAISTHPSPGAMSFSSLFLTSSLDWTVRLWSTHEHKPLHTFENYFDYVYDVSWSPVHPAVFAAVDGTGRLDVWNINQDVEVPCARRVIQGLNNSPTDKPGRGSVALNKCSWDSTGTHLATGDNHGRVTICSVHETLSQPNPEQWPLFAHNLAELKHFNAEPDMRVEL